MIHFSARLDETDTHDASILTVVGGAVATMGQWRSLEAAWKQHLKVSKVNSFHYKDMLARSGEFKGWKQFAVKRFLKRTTKIIDENVSFRVVAAVDPKAHSEIKKRMKHIKGFASDSDYGLCLRWVLFQCCEYISKELDDDNFTLSVILEDGPYSSGAVDLFHKLKRMTGGNKPAKHASKYGDICVLGKESPSLQIADAIVGIEADHFKDSVFNRRRDRLSVRLDKSNLEKWYRMMLDEKERRRNYRAAQKRILSNKR